MRPPFWLPPLPLHAIALTATEPILLVIAVAFAAATIWVVSRREI